MPYDKVRSPFENYRLAFEFELQRKQERAP